MTANAFARFKPAVHAAARAAAVCLPIVAAVCATAVPATAHAAADPPSGAEARGGGSALAPRAALETAGVEAVFVAGGGGLYAFVDTIDGNEPATLRLLTATYGKRRHTLEPIGPGLYRAAPLRLPPGLQTLTVALHFPDRPEPVEATIRLEMPKAAAGSGGGKSRAWLWVFSIVAVAAAAGGAWTMRARIGARIKAMTTGGGHVLGDRSL